jgi:hypothetical protein
MTTPSGTELREWLDRLAIQDLINRYSDAVTRADWQQCQTLLAVDAVWESPAGLRFESAKSFMDFLKPTTSYDLLIPTPHSSVITLTDIDQASATTTIHELTRGVGLADSEFGETGAEINLEQGGSTTTTSPASTGSGSSAGGSLYPFTSARIASQGTCSPRGRHC